MTDHWTYAEEWDHEESEAFRTKSLTAAQTALRDAESHVAQRRQELQAAVLAARQNRSLADIARELGVSKQRVDQISRGK